MNAPVTSSSADDGGSVSSDVQVDRTVSGQDEVGASVWIRVALDVPLRGLFDYRGKTSEAPIGSRVIVPFGNRKLIGVVVAHPVTPDTQEDLIRDVEQYLS